MSLYEVAKDALKIAQKADNVDLIQNLLEVQKMALDMQEKEQKLQAKIGRLEAEILELRDVKKFVFVDGHDYMIDQAHPDRELCPVCTKKNNFAVPLGNSQYCHTCKRFYS